jgi:hypothetical protein
MNTWKAAGYAAKDVAGRTKKLREEYEGQSETPR